MIIPLDQLTAAPLDPFTILPDEDHERMLLAAATDVTILLTGETGTGKGQLARAIAAHSSRPTMLEVNCAALPDELLGSELFGHRRGAFTGAVADRKGLLMSAAGKTVFLDEIGEISPTMQRMLLRVVQRSHRTLKPLGADQEEALPPVRFIFATNRDLESEVRAGRFREDLLRRIDVVDFTVPPLRSRPDLIPAYTGRFLTELSRIHDLACVGMEKELLVRLATWPWPGNVRELKNVLEKALVTSPRRRGREVTLTELARPRAATPASSSVMTLVEAEKACLLAARAAADGDVLALARLLGLKSRGAVYARYRKHGIKP